MLDDASNPVPAPARTVSDSAPSGPVGSTVTCCPDATVFLAPEGDDAAYFGFDDTTNGNEVHQQLYWMPQDRKKNDPPLAPLSEIQQARDGANWASVPVGEVIQLNTFFLGALACIANCTYEVQSASIASVVDPKPGPGMDRISIRGEAEGEAVLKVFCNGTLLGYVYLWCRKIVTVEVGMGTIIVSSADHRSTFNRKPLTTWPINGLEVPIKEKMETELNTTFRPALLRFAVTDFDIVDFDSADPQVRDTVRRHVFDGPYPIVNNLGEIEMRALNGAPAPYWQSGVIETSKLARARVGGGKAYNLWMLSAPELPAVGAMRRDIYGVVNHIPGTDAFVFVLLSSLYGTAAHELGHALGLRHPSDPAATVQYPAHVLAGTDWSSNIAPKHPENLMSYQDNARMLLYGQWRIAHENAANMMQGIAGVATPPST